MKRIAFFVEGQTEQVFVNSLIKAILGTDHINIIQKQFTGGARVPKQEFVRSASYARKPRYEVLISNCGSDNRVKSEILDNIENLRATGYSMVIGLRDLYPIPIEEYEKLERGLRFLPHRLKKETDHFDIVIAIHEIEAWFLAETNHLRKVDKRLTGHFIREHLGFNPYTSNPEERTHPARDLSNIYNLVGKSYTKRYWQVNRLVNRLDFNYMINYVRYQLEPLNKLITIIENFRDEK